MKTEYAYVVAVTSLDASAVATTEYFSFYGYATASLFTPDANAHIKPLLSKVGFPARHRFGKHRTMGPKAINSDTAEFVNTQGQLDHWKSRAFDGQPYKVWRVERASMGDYSGYELVFSGVCSNVEVDFESCRLQVHDVAHLLNKPILTARYSGVGALEASGTGFEGRVKPLPLGDVSNVSPPLVNGTLYVYHVSVRQLPTASDLDEVYDSLEALTLGVNSRSLAQIQAAPSLKTFTVDAGTDVVTTTAAHGLTTGNDITVVASAGGSLPTPLLATSYYYVRVLSATTLTLHPSAVHALANTSIVDLTDVGSGTLQLATNRTAQGCYDVCNDATSGCYFRLGAKPNGRITCDLSVDCDTANVTTVTPPVSTTSQQQVRALLMELRSMLGSLPASTPYVNTEEDVGRTGTSKAGLWIDTDMTYLEAFDLLAASLGGCWYFESGLSSTLYVRALFTNTASQPANGELITKDQIVRRGGRMEIARVIPQDDMRGVPPWQVNVYAARNYTVMSPADAPGATTTEQAAAGREYQQVGTDSNSNIQTRWQNAPELNVFTCLAPSAAIDVRSLAEGLIDMYSLNDGEDVHDMLNVEVPFDAFPTLDIDGTVTLPLDRFDMDDGKVYEVIGWEPRIEKGGISTKVLTLWGGVWDMS